MNDVVSVGRERMRRSLGVFDQSVITFDFSQLGFPANAQLKIIPNQTFRVQGTTGQGVHIKDLPGVGGFELLPTSVLKGNPVVRGMYDMVMPMHQDGAMFVQMDSRGYPFFVKIESEGINTATAAAEVAGAPVVVGAGQNGYMVRSPRLGATQQYVDGYKKLDQAGAMQQFVAAPLGAGITPGEQLGTSVASTHGLRVTVIPMDKAYYEQHVRPKLEVDAAPVGARSVRGLNRGGPPDMGLAAGGTVIGAPLIVSDYPPEAWDMASARSTVVGVLNAQQWQQVTGHPIPHRSPNPQDFRDRGISPTWHGYIPGRDVGAVASESPQFKTIDEIMVGLGLAPDKPFTVQDRPARQPGATDDGVVVPGSGVGIGARPRCPAGTRC